MSSDAPPQSPMNAKPQRVLACVLCQQRKVKCDRKSPCANCIKSRAQCVPATLARRRRRRKFPEQDLLERLHKYESLLRENNITFEPLQKASSEVKLNPDDEELGDSDDEHTPATSTTIKSEGGSRTKNIWHAMSQGFRDPDNDSDSSHDDVRGDIIKKAWDQAAGKDDHLLFGTWKTTIDLSGLHPGPIQIFRLWQTFLDNVNPLLKVTHTPSLQGRIIEAAGNLRSIDRDFEALMFSIYCMAVLSLTTEDCQTMLGSPKEDLLTKYQFACQQALLKCGFLKCSDRDCLAALFFYLFSVRSNTSPQSLSSLLGVAIRIAQRMGMHSEAALTKCTALEAEMRRRLWWSLVLFDSRMCELAGSRTVTLDPTWDCKIPLNVNDADLRSEMKGPPAVQGRPTEALFTVIRSEIAEFTRHSAFHLDFTSPALKPIAKLLQPGSATEAEELSKLEERIESQYLQFCDPDNPVHFMIIWTTRAHLARCQLLAHHARFSSSPARQTDIQRDAATAHALRMLECDAQTMSSPLTRGYRWLNHLHFPFPAYVQLVQDLRRRPRAAHSPRAWAVMSDNYEAWFGPDFSVDDPVMNVFTNIVVAAWDAYEAACRPVTETPRIISRIRHMRGSLARQHAPAADTGGGQPDVLMGTGPASDDFPTPTFTDFDSQSLPLGGVDVLDGHVARKGNVYSGISGDVLYGADLNQWDWTMLGGQPGWGGF